MNLKVETIDSDSASQKTDDEIQDDFTPVLLSCNFIPLPKHHFVSKKYLKKINLKPKLPTIQEKKSEIYSLFKIKKCCQI